LVSTRSGGGDKRELIVKASADVFAERGFASTRVADIAERAGIGKGTVYEYFSSKEELLFAVFEWINDGIANRVQEALAEGGSSHDRLVRLLRIGAEVVQDQVEMQAVTLDFWAASRGSGLEDRFNKACLASYRTFREIIAGIVREGQAGGEFLTDIDAEAIATMIVSAMDGLGVQIFFDRSLDPYQAVDGLAGVLLRGLEGEAT
jgi:AcrR family transcriptional regulator